MTPTPISLPQEQYLLFTKLIDSQIPT